MKTSYGYCKCGCGEKTVVSHRTDKSKGWIKGEPRNFIRGHQARVQKRESKNQIIDEKMKCRVCNNWKEIRDFEKDKRKKYGITSRCFECTRKYKNSWMKQDREKNVELYREKKRKYYEQNKEHYTNYRNKWRSENKEKMSAHYLRMRAKYDYNATGDCTEVQIKDRFDYFNNQCWICGKIDSIEVDHIKPLSKNGTHFASNIRPVCHTCNVKKRDKWYGVKNLNKIIEEITQSTKKVTYPANLNEG